MTADTSDGRMRLDIWLWRARFFKTRGTAADAIQDSGMRIERDGMVRRIDKPATTLATGDLISFSNPAGMRVVRVISLPDRRGPAAEASQCYAVIGDQQGATHDQSAGQRSGTADRT